MNIINSTTIQVNDKLDKQRLIKVAAFDQSKNITNPHKHNGYLELVYLSSTTGRHYIDGRESIIKTPCILVVKKDSVHYWKLNNPVEGFVLLLKHQFFAESFDFEIARLVDRICLHDIIYLDNFEAISSLFEVLSTEENRICQEGLLKAILAKVLEYSTMSGQISSPQQNIYTRFCALLNQDLKVVNNVAYYASKLNTSPQNLTAACKKNSNLTASEIIASYIVQDAKRLLLYTTSSISELAYELGFSDKSNFSKYFKRFTGITPRVFRQQQA